MRAASLCLVLALSSTAAYAVDMQEGKWEMKMRTEQPGEKPTEMTMTQCMDKDQVLMQSGAASPYASKDGHFEMDDGDCKVKYDTKGNVATMESTCKSGDTMKTVTTYNAGDFNMKSTVTSAGVTTVSSMEGKRLGGC